MRSTVSTSIQLSPATRLGILLCLLIVTMASVEYFARIMHDRRSATQAIEQGVRRALHIRSRPDSRQLLFAGNSLVFDDLSQIELQRSLGPGFLVYTAGIPGSTYYDWRLGFRALFTRDSQPDVIVFGISPSQFLREPATTPLPVSILWGPREIIAYQREERLSLTQLSELLLEHYSTYYALRDIVRTHVRKLIPGYESMVDRWSGSKGRPEIEAGPAAEALFSDKLATLAAECRSRSQLVLMLSPTNQVEDEKLEPYLRSAANRLGIAITEPIAQREWPLTKFRDDKYHLTPPAAAEFSRLVAADLRRKLADSTNQAVGQ
jgi:hypothetical protein